TIAYCYSISQKSIHIPSWSQSYWILCNYPHKQRSNGCCNSRCCKDGTLIHSRHTIRKLFNTFQRQNRRIDKQNISHYQKRRHSSQKLYAVIRTQLFEPKILLQPISSSVREKTNEQKIAPLSIDKSATTVLIRKKTMKTYIFT